MMSFFSVCNLYWTIYAQEKLDISHDEGPWLSQTARSKCSLCSDDYDDLPVTPTDTILFR